LLKLFRFLPLDNHALIESLFSKYLKGVSTTEELELLETLIAKPENADFLRTLMLKEMQQPEDSEQSPDQDQLKKLGELFANIKKNLPE